MPRRMTAEQYCYPQAIYAFSRMLHEIWDTHVYPEGDQSDGEKAVVVPSRFSKHSRVFHWLAVASEQWDWSQGHFTPQSFQPAIENGERGTEADEHDWLGFREELRSRQLNHLTEAVKYIREYVGQNEPHYHRHLLSLYADYPIVADRYFDGIIYRNLRKRPEHNRNIGIAYAYGELMRIPGTYAKDGYPWADIAMQGTDEQPFGCVQFQCQEADAEVALQEAIPQW